MVDKQQRDRIYQAIIDGDKSAVVGPVTEALESGQNPLALINEVLNPALKEVGDKFDCGDMFLPQLIMSAEAMEAAVEVIKPQLEAQQQTIESPGRVVMATVQGDVHDIGKNIVVALLQANGFTVLDLGRDVPAGEIVRKAEEFDADIIGLSALLSTTLPYCRDVVRLLDEKSLREKYHVFIGGGPVTPEYAEEIGAHYGGAHAEEGVRRMMKAMGRA
jgi:5-methyltetrahydrofolate--homocysteine methyltransferase